MLGAAECLGDISHGSVWLIPGLGIYQLRVLLVQRAALSLLPGEGSDVFLGGTEGSWRSFLYCQVFA